MPHSPSRALIPAASAATRHPLLQVQVGIDSPPQHPLTPHSRLAAAHTNGVQAGAEQAVGAQPRFPKGELLPFVLTGSCKGNSGDENTWACAEGEWKHP